MFGNIKLKIFAALDRLTGAAEAAQNYEDQIRELNRGAQKLREELRYVNERRILAEEKENRTKTAFSAVARDTAEISELRDHLLRLVTGLDTLHTLIHRINHAADDELEKHRVALNSIWSNAHAAVSFLEKMDERIDNDHYCRSFNVSVSTQTYDPSDQVIVCLSAVRDSYSVLRERPSSSYELQHFINKVTGSLQRAVSDWVAHIVLEDAVEIRRNIKG